jgi:hypothetical protein
MDMDGPLSDGLTPLDGNRVGLDAHTGCVMRPASPLTTQDAFDVHREPAGGIS